MEGTVLGCKAHELLLSMFPVFKGGAMLLRYLANLLT